ncbi:MAG: 3-oxoacyl-ACP reductase [Fibrobacteres bacterium]|nr:3-oxoacyl-ACP reductase [Fibrobacterota bacterium]
MELGLASKRILVTGGSSGIGEAIVRLLSAEGAKVGINFGHHPGPAESLAAEIGASGGEAITIPADVADPEAVAGMFGKMDGTWGGTDILINNAGIDGKHALAWEADPEEWRKVIEVNLFGAFHCAREALKRMVPRGEGVILNITSVHEEIAWSGYSAYCAAKAGVGILSKTLAQEAAPHGIRVLSLAPGAIKTPINRSVWNEPEGMRDLLEKIPMNRMGEAEEIARMAAVLVSDIGSYATGTTVFVDGGMTDYPDFAHGG